MNKSVNYWDWVIGIGYGIFMTLILLRIEEVISQDVMFAGWIIWVATLGLQTLRLLKLQKAKAAVSQ